MLSAATAVAQPVTNGSDDADDPAVVALVTSTGAVTCTASVIGPHTLLTAAHCVATRDPTTLRAFFGANVATGSAYVAIADARIHPGFDPGGRDIAVLTLRSTAPVAPLAVLGLTLDVSLVDANIRVVGFGLTGQNAADEGTKRVGVARIASVTEEELIAVPDPSLPCPGDSGGPALLPEGTIAGVVSRVDSMCNDHAVYTRVDIARGVLIDPYLADTAPGTANEGDACFYLEQCAADLECYAGTCESPAGCGCRTSGSSSWWIALACAALLATGRRAPRRRRRA